MSPTIPIDPGNLGPDEFEEKPDGQEPPEVEDDAPRRAASARFIVDSEVGSDALLRNAMDPANQSLADALRLSYRVLQLVILALLVLFLASGFQTVDEGKSGVRTVWGRIVPYDGSDALAPGLKISMYPQPVGEFILFDVDNRNVDLGTAFAPNLRGRTRADATENADSSASLAPGNDGSLLTSDGDLAHMELTAKYVIDYDGVVKFVDTVADADKSRDSSKLVKLAIQNAAIRVTAGLTLAQLGDTQGAEDARSRIEADAQKMLDGLDCGIRIQHVTLVAVYAPLAIEKTKGDLQAAKVAATEARDTAEKQRSETLNKIAGPNYQDFIDLIEKYEKALDLGDEAASNEALAAINAKLESNEASGEVSNIISYARTYQSQIESTLGIEAKRFTTLLPEFRRSPQLVVNQLWLEAKSKVTNRPDTEILYVPDALQSVLLSLNGSADIADIRMKNLIQARQMLKYKDADPLGLGYILRGGDMSIGKAGRQLEVVGGSETKVKPKGGPQ